MQACARIGATHSVVFGGFSAKSLQERIIDAGAIEVITADGQYRGGREIPLKPAVDEALSMGGCEKVEKRHRLQAHRQRGGDAGAARQVVARGRGRTGGHLRAHLGQRRASAVHPVHVRLDRQAEGRAALDRRLPAAGDGHHEVGVRSQAHRRLLVHGGRRLGHRPHLHRLRPARGAARPRSCSRACRPIPTPAGSGR